MKWAHLWVVHFSGLLKCRLSGGIVFDVLQRMMASFIAGQQRNNIPHVDRTPYSPQRSRGSARPFLPELSSRSSSPLARQLSPSCFVRPQPDALNYIWILSPSPSLSPHSAVACYFASLSESCPGITVTKSPTEKSNKTSRRRSHDAANSLRDSRPAAAQTTASVKCFQQLNLTATSPLLHPCETSPTPQKWKMNSIITSQTAAKRILIEFNCRGDWKQILLCAVHKRQALSSRPALMPCYEGERIAAEGRKDIHSMGIDLALLSRATYNE